MKKSQKNIVKEHLRQYGFVSRNACLNMRITRLSAIICDLAKETNAHGEYIYQFDTKQKDGDYIYTQTNRKKIVYQQLPPTKEYPNGRVIRMEVAI